MKREIKRFWKMLESNRFIKSTNSITDEVEIIDGGIVDMEATIQINGEFDKEAIDNWLYEHLKDNLKS